MDFLKQCPLLICVLITSLLIPWELIKKDQDETKAPPTNAQVEIMTNEEADSTDLVQNVSEVTTVEAGMEETDDPVTTTTTTEVGGCIPLEQADESYFEDALFMGNSRTVGLYLFGDMPEQTDFFADVGLTIYDAMDSTIEVPPQSGSTNTLSAMLQAKQYGKIYMMFGINELGMGTSESFAEYYQSVVEQVRQMQPDAIIYIQSIINVSSFAETDIILNSNINEKNALLAQLADDQQIFYIDLNPTLTDANGYLNEDYTSDGIHLGGSSLPLWKDCLLSHAMQKSSGSNVNVAPDSNAGEETESDMVEETESEIE